MKSVYRFGGMPTVELSMGKDENFTALLKTHHVAIY
jgi:hypothetical protein